tara:strand:- start:80 stop:289 length:210 start_codon:yes stop_codon:yes gene_type:complete
MTKRKITIHDLKLHETLWVEEIDADVTKVASGWLYKYTKQKWIEKDSYYDLVITHIVFVPYDKTWHEGK